MTMVLQIIDLLYIKYKIQESIVIYISNHWMETTRERVCQYYWKKVGNVLYVHSKENKPRKDILWHPKASTENLITKYTAKARKKDVAKRSKKKKIDLKCNSTQLGFFL